MNRWESFASSDPYYYIDTDFDTFRDEPDAVDRFYEGGRAAAAELLAEVASLLPGRTCAIEIGCGVGRVLLGHVGDFRELRGVDVAPQMLSLLKERASSLDAGNVQGFLSTQAWDEPAASADYVYSLHVFQHIEAKSEIATYISRIARVLGPGGIAQLHFDTRSRGVLYRMRPYVPDRLLGRTQRRGMRRIRRDPVWIRKVLADAHLEVVSERSPDSADHYFVVRRRPGQA